MNKVQNIALRLWVGLIFVLSFGLAYAQSNNLTINVQGFDGNGTAYIMLFKEGQKFKPDCQDCLKKRGQIENEQITFSFTRLPAGNYAAMVFHDQDENGELKTNFLGMPREGVGTSTNHQGIPSFKKCQFIITGDTSIEIDIVYL